MEQTETVGTEAGDVLVVHEVLALELELVVFVPVAAHRQDGVGATDHGDHVRQRNLRLVFAQRVALEVQVHVGLIQRETVVVQVAEAGLFVLGLVDLADGFVRVTDLHVTVEASFLQLDDLVLGLAHDVCQAVASLDVGRAVGQEDVFGRNKNRHLAVKAWVEVDLLERGAGGGERPQHALVLSAELLHHLRELEVHVSLDTLRGFFLVRGLFADDLGAHRSGSRERLGDCF